MLPLPISLSSRRHIAQQAAVSIWDIRIRTLLSRSRATNLAVLLLSTCAALSLILNFHFIIRGAQHTRPGPGSDRPGRGAASASSQAARLKALERHLEIAIDPVRQELNHLIIVPGHAIWNGHSERDALNEEAWILEPYQKGKRSVEAVLEHIKRGSELALEDPKSLLVFSGGQSRLSAMTTESSSYFRLAHALDLFNNTHTDNLPFSRATTEAFALDSYQNVIFSIARFREYTSRYPLKITIFGFGMKKRRFEELHRKAIRWPLEGDRWQYIGVDLEGDIKDEYSGEYLNGYLPFTRDLYGCHSYLLAKRRQRNPFSRFHPYHTSAPEIASLLDWCPPEIQGAELGDTDKMVFPRTMPWEVLP